MSPKLKRKFKAYLMLHGITKYTVHLKRVSSVSLSKLIDIKNETKFFYVTETVSLSHCAKKFLIFSLDLSTVRLII